MAEEQCKENEGMLDFFDWKGLSWYSASDPAIDTTWGQGELQMIDFAEDSVVTGRRDTIIARPGMVVKRGS